MDGARVIVARGVGSGHSAVAICTCRAAQNRAAITWSRVAQGGSDDRRRHSVSWRGVRSRWRNCEWMMRASAPPSQDGWATLVITSPPYANNYDYADATRLEMAFMGEIRGWGDLQETVQTAPGPRLLATCAAEFRESRRDSGITGTCADSRRDCAGVSRAFVRATGTWRQENLQQHGGLLLPRHGADVAGAAPGLCIPFGGLFRHRRFRALWRLCAGHRVVRQTGAGGGI